MPDEDLKDYEQQLKKQREMRKMQAKYTAPQQPGIAGRAANAGWNWLYKFATEKPKRKRMES